MKTQPFDLLTYVNTHITFRGTIARRSLPGEERCRQNEVITLEEAALPYACQAHTGILVPSSSNVMRPSSRLHGEPGGTSAPVILAASNELSGGGWRRQGKITGANLHYSGSAVSPNSKLFFN